MIETLRGRIVELVRDADRETGLNRDAGETIARLEWEVDQLLRASEGHDDRLAEAADIAREASAILTDREGLLSQATEDAARLAARHQSVQRMLADSRATLAKAEGEAARARDTVTAAETALTTATEGFDAATVPKPKARHRPCAQKLPPWPSWSNGNRWRVIRCSIFWWSNRAWKRPSARLWRMICARRRSGRIAALAG
jgi:ABC-type transporter Mla subunit MlaD